MIRSELILYFAAPEVNIGNIDQNEDEMEYEQLLTVCHLCNVLMYLNMLQPTLSVVTQSSEGLVHLVYRLKKVRPDINFSFFRPKTARKVKEF